LLNSETEQVWAALREERGLAGFTLIRGTALSLLINHRISEDLDFVWIGEKLPRRTLEAVLLSPASPIDFEPRDDPAALEEFELGGLDLRDYQQDYIANGRVKVSFFTPSAGLEKVLGAADPKNVRVASLPELFRAKCLVSAQRSKTRDWLDLYLLMRDHGFTLEDYEEAFSIAKMSGQMELGLTKLCSGTPQKNDEGYSYLLPKAPSLEDMQTFFIQARDAYEVRRAAARAGRSAPPLT
jgi:hypothetical protein